MGAQTAGGNSTNAAKNLLNQAQGFAGPGSQIMSGFQSSLGTAQGNQAGQLASSGDTISDLRTASATGGYDPAALASLQAQTARATATGGYDPNQLAGLQTQTANMTTTGGYDPTQLNQNMQGYTDLATTGGYTPQQGQQFIQQATEGTQATYGALADQAKRSQTATGGLGSGGGISQMARQLSQVQGQNTLNAEVELNERQTANKLSGLGGEAALQGQVAGAKLGAQGQQLGLASDVAGKALTGQSQQLGLASDVAGKTLSGTEAAGGLMNQLYNTTTGQVTALGNQVLNALGLDFNTQEEAAGLLYKLSTNKPLWSQIADTVIQAGGAAAGAAAAL